MSTECAIALLIFLFFFFFFFSSRRRHTRYIGDWSSDVCSSDLLPQTGHGRRHASQEERPGHAGNAAARTAIARRSEERRVGKECRARWGAEHSKKKRRSSGR